MRAAHIPPGRLVYDDDENEVTVREEESAYARKPPSPKEGELLFDSQDVVPEEQS